MKLILGWNGVVSVLFLGVYLCRLSVGLKRGGVDKSSIS